MYVLLLLLLFNEIRYSIIMFYKEIQTFSSSSFKFILLFVKMKNCFVLIYNFILRISKKNVIIIINII